MVEGEGEAVRGMYAKSVAHIRLRGKNRGTIYMKEIG